MANNVNECEEVHHRSIAICGREVVRTHVKKVRKGDKIDDGENNTLCRVIVIGVALIMIIILVAKLVSAYVKNILLEEENKRLSNAKEEDDEHITLLKWFSIFMFIFTIAMILGCQHKN